MGFGSYRVGEQPMLRRAYAAAQARLIIGCTITQCINVEEAPGY